MTSTPMNENTMKTELDAAEGVKAVEETKEQIKEAEDFSELARKAIVDEDYPMNFKIQDSINSKANKEFIFGRNEPIQQHYHKWVDKLSSK